MPIIPQLLPLLLEHEGHWIPTNVKHQTLGYRWRIMRAALGMTADVVPKTIRHTIATHLWNARVSPHCVAMLLGHVAIVPWRDFDDISPDYYDAVVPPLSELWDEVHDLADKWLGRYAVVQTERGNRLVIDRDKLSAYGERPRRVSPYDVVSPRVLCAA